MSKSAKSEGRRKAAGNGQLWLRLPDLVRDALYETVIGAGAATARRSPGRIDRITYDLRLSAVVGACCVSPRGSARTARQCIGC
jgi:hypothetical protein